MEEVYSENNYERVDVEFAVRKELERSALRYSGQEAPVAVILAGQPGAGKTQLSSIFRKAFSNDCAFINGDDYRRLHPFYRELNEENKENLIKMTSRFSAEITETLIQKMSDCRYNLIIEGTGRTATVPLNTTRILKGKGYRVELAALCVRPIFSLASIILRFYSMKKMGTIPRATALHAHDYVVSVLPGNLDLLAESELIDRLSIWNREKEMLYSSYVNSELPSQVMKVNWNSAWDEREKTDLWAVRNAIIDCTDCMIDDESGLMNVFFDRVNRILQESSK